MQNQLKQQLSGQGGMKHLYGKNRPAQAGIPVAETGIPPRRDGTKNVPPPYKQYAIKTIETYACRDPGHRPVPANVPSRLSYKQVLDLVVRSTELYSDRFPLSRSLNAFTILLTITIRIFTTEFHVRTIEFW